MPRRTTTTRWLVVRNGHATAPHGDLTSCGCGSAAGHDDPGVDAAHGGISTVDPVDLRPVVLLLHELSGNGASAFPATSSCLARRVNSVLAGKVETMCRGSSCPPARMRGCWWIVRAFRRRPAGAGSGGSGVDAPRRGVSCVLAVRWRQVSGSVRSVVARPGWECRDAVELVRRGVRRQRGPPDSWADRRGGSRPAARFAGTTERGRKGVTHEAHGRETAGRHRRVDRAGESAGGGVGHR